MYTLFFDSETCGVPRNYNAPASDVNNWPRLVQLGWMVWDGLEFVKEREYIVKPDGFEIPLQASSVHGITTEKAMTDGRELREVMEFFGDAVGLSDLIVGHNVNFDLGIVGAEFHRTFGYNPLDVKKTVCTMRSSVEFCQIPGPYGYKWPKLTELWLKLFETELPQTHTALEDIRYTAACFFELEKRGVIKLNSVFS